MSTPAPLTKVPGEMPPALSQAERVIDTFIAPSKTFTDISPQRQLVAAVADRRNRRIGAGLHHR